MALITAILIILAVLAVIMLLILLIPFHISIIFCKEGGLLKGAFEIRWFKIRIIKREFPEEEKAEKIESIEKAEKKEEEKAKKLEEKEKPSKWKWEDIKRTLLLSWESLPHFLNFFNTVLSSIKLEKMNLHLILGLNSPVDTAKTMGYFWATSSIINISQKVYISGEPSFLEEKVDLTGDISFKIRLLTSFLASLKLLTKLSVLKLLWELRRFR